MGWGEGRELFLGLFLGDGVTTSRTMRMLREDRTISQIFARAIALIVIVTSVVYPTPDARADNPCDQPNQEARRIGVAMQAAIPGDATDGKFVAEILDTRDGPTTAVSLAYRRGGSSHFSYQLRGQEAWGFGTVSAAVSSDGKRLTWRHHSPGSGRYYCEYRASISSGRLVVATAEDRVLWSGPLGPEPNRGAPSTLAPAWYGTWRSADGRTILKISASHIDVSDLREFPNESPKRVSFRYRWSDASEIRGDRYETFGYSDERLTPNQVRQRYEAAVRRLSRDAEDFKVSDPATSRAALRAIGDGVYKVMWAYAGGDLSSEYIIDGDQILEVQESKYYFGVRLFRRTRPSVISKSSADASIGFHQPADQRSPGTLSGPSFDCSKARAWAEKVICSDPELAALDQELASAYRSARARHSDTRSDSLKQEQRAWLRRRDACEGRPQSFGCLRRAYEIRISELRD